MLVRDVAKAIEGLRPALIEECSDIELLDATELGVVRVCLSGPCCSDSVKELITLLDVEKNLKEQVRGVRIVINDRQVSPA